MRDCYPIQALLDDQLGPLTPEAKNAVGTADVIFARDVDSGEELLLYGRAAFERAVESGESDRLRILYIELDRDTYELRMACIIVEKSRGECEYKKEGA